MADGLIKRAGLPYQESAHRSYAWFSFTGQVAGTVRAFNAGTGDLDHGLVYLPTGNAPPDYYGAYAMADSSSIIA
ncbi:hypothetical protein [Pseudomonas sp.]|uniref:hypothetical protein n=1 Tax=Pseudomonas sp. TaxID=306 RepID=UPI00257F2059|nr:hypothetical protein [Pseudomonas sp.]